MSDVLDVHVPAGRIAPTAEQRLIAAALRCMARWGVAKTTLDDVAREAACSRATVYRVFPGGKDALMAQVATAELTSFFDRLTTALDAADSLEDAVVAAITEAGRTFAGHAALRFLMTHEPEVVLPRLCFAEMDAVLALVVSRARPALSRWVREPEADALAEWATRITLSYAMCPTPEVDLADSSSVRRLVRAFVLPALVTT